MENLDPDIIKKLGTRTLNEEDHSYFIFKLTLEHSKIVKQLNNADFTEYLSIWKTFAFRYYPIGRRILHVPLEFKDDPSRFRLIIYRNLHNIYEQLKKEIPDANQEWFSNVYLGFISFSMRNMAHASELFFESLKFDNSSAEIWSFLGCIFFECKEYVDAMRAFERSILIDSLFYGNYLLLSNCYRKLKHFESIFDVTERGLRLFRDDWCLLMELAGASKILRKGDYFLEINHKAIQSLSKIKDKYPSEGEIN